MIGQHIPVLLEEVLFYLDCCAGGVYVDATLGDGGHAVAICSRLGAGGRLIGIDWDEAALKRASARLAGFANQISLIHSSYTALETILEHLGYPCVDGILLDLGVSTLQLLEPSRGFSYQSDQPLDMRMDHTLPVTAADLVNDLPADQLRQLIYRYGEERWAGRIAARIETHRRKHGPIKTGGALAEIIKEAVPAAARRSGGHPARQTFQALRIAVNRELDNIETVLPQAVRCLAPGGRLCVIAYHSLEDRIVKHFFKEKAARCHCPPQAPCICGGEAELDILTRKAVKTQPLEVEQNPRSRSARLRAAVRQDVLKKEAGE
ncbi:MAG: 16S rRNA (cytosine(1402)-N(4))-methyltransferase RsmH [Bacillota bacterium]